MTRREVFEQAHALVQARKLQEELEMEQRRSKIIAVLPEIVEEEKILQRASIEISTMLLRKKQTLNQSIESIMSENVKAQQRIKSLLRSKGFDENALEIHYTCPLCHDSGYIKGDRCSCVYTLVKQLSVQDFNHNNGMKLKTFSEFNLDYYKKSPVEFQTMQQILQFCHEYAQTFSMHSKNILMTGKTGLGKTHLSLAIAEQVLGQGFQVLYGSTQDFFGKIQQEYFNRSKMNTDTMDVLLGVDLLILDDLGAEFESNFNTSTLYNVINSRLNLSKPTIINTNLTLQEIQARYSDRIASRLLTVYSGLRFVGTDVRQLQYLATKQGSLPNYERR